MKFFTSTLVFAAVVSLLGIVAAAPDRARRNAVSADPEAPAPERPLPTDPHEIDVAYAETYLKLAKLDLQKMLDVQNRVQGAITSSQFDRVEGLVRVAEDNLRLIKENKSSRATLNLVRARESLRTAEHIWKTAQQVRTTANAISDTELTRLRIAVELERLAVAKAEVAAASGSPMEVMQLEMDQMRDEMLRLRYRFEALTARR